MKKQFRCNFDFTRLWRLRNMMSLGIVVVFCLLSKLSFSQAVDVVNPISNQTYKLPDPATMQTAADLQAAIATAETAGKALNADAAKERAVKLNDINKAKTANSDYVTALNNFNKNEVIPYNTDLNNYTASGTKFNEFLATYNKAAQANNALAAKDRKAATVAALNKQKAQIDAWGIKLTKWKAKLDAAKAKLDIDNAALQKQKQKSDAANQAITEKSKTANFKLNALLDQLTICANYAVKCHSILISKFSYPNTPDASYFSSPVYRSAIAELVSAMKN